LLVGGGLFGSGGRSSGSFLPAYVRSGIIGRGLLPGAACVAAEVEGGRAAVETLGDGFGGGRAPPAMFDGGGRAPPATFDGGVGLEDGIAGLFAEEDDDGDAVAGGGGFGLGPEAAFEAAIGGGATAAVAVTGFGW